LYTCAAQGNDATQFKEVGSGDETMDSLSSTGSDAFITCRMRGKHCECAESSSATAVERHHQRPNDGIEQWNGSSQWHCKPHGDGSGHYNSSW
jgi:hypothetical protein